MDLLKLLEMVLLVLGMLTRLLDRLGRLNRLDRLGWLDGRLAGLLGPLAACLLLVGWVDMLELMLLHGPAVTHVRLDTARVGLGLWHELERVGPDRGEYWIRVR